MPHHVFVKDADYIRIRDGSNVLQCPISPKSTVHAGDIILIHDERGYHLTKKVTAVIPGGVFGIPFNEIFLSLKNPD
jgi:hypothetical protein